MSHLPHRDDVHPRVATTTSDSREIDAVAAAESRASTDAIVARVRMVHRAASELKRGVPVLLEGTAGLSLALLPAETAGASGLRDLARLAAMPCGEGNTGSNAGTHSADAAATATPGTMIPVPIPVLLLAPTRAAAVLRRPVPQESAHEASVVAVHAGAALLSPGPLRSLADPTVAQILPEPVTRAPIPAEAATALSLAKIARLLPAVLAVPVGADAAARATTLGLLTVPAADVRAYADTVATGLVRVAEAHVPLDGAPDARIVAFRAPDAGIEHLAILIGRPETASAQPPLVRVHSECFTGDLLGSLRCDCGPQLRGAIRRMAEAGAGVLIYLAQEGRGIGLVNKLRAYALQDRGMDTIDANRALGWGADERNFLIAATMLDALGIDAVRLLTNNPDKVAALAACGVTVVDREALVFAPNGVNDTYLATKASRFGHYLG